MNARTQLPNSAKTTLWKSMEEEYEPSEFTLSALEAPDFEYENEDSDDWAVMFTNLLPMTSWLSGILLQAIASKTVASFIPGFEPDKKLISASAASNYDLPRYGSSRLPRLAEHLEIKHKEAGFDTDGSTLASRATQPLLIKQAKKKDGYKLSVGWENDSIPRILGDAARSGDNLARVSSIGGRSLAIKKVAIRKAMLKHYGTEFFDIERPYHKSFKLEGTFESIFNEYSEISLKDIVVNTLTHIGMQDWMFLWGNVDIDVTERSVALSLFADAYIEDLNATVTSYELVSPPMLNGSGINLKDSEGVTFICPSISATKNCTFSDNVKSSLEWSLGKETAETYTPEFYHIDSVISGRMTTSHLTVNLSTDFAENITQTEGVDDHALGDWFRNVWFSASSIELYDKQGSPVEALGNGHVEQRRLPIKHVINHLSDRKKPTSIGVNSDGIGIDADGMFIYIPVELNDVTKHITECENFYKKNVNADGSTFIMDVDPLDIPASRKMAISDISVRPRQEPLYRLNKPLYVDWSINALIGTSDIGTLAVMRDLSHITPFLAGHLVPYLEAHIVDMSHVMGYGLEGPSAKPNVYGAITGVLSYTFAKRAEAFIDADALQEFINDSAMDMFNFNGSNGKKAEISPDRILSIVQGIGSRIRSIPNLWESLHHATNRIARVRIQVACEDGTIPVENLGGEHSDYISIAEELSSKDFIRLRNLDLNSASLLMRTACYILSKIWEGVDGKPEIIMQSRSFDNAINEYATLSVVSSVITGKIPQKYLTYSFEDTDKQAPAGTEPNPIAGLREGYSALPHQLRADYHLNSATSKAASLEEDELNLGGILYTVLFGQAGCGKTHLVINDVMRKLEAGLIKRPLVICPAYLIKNYIEDAAYMTEGRLNVVPLTTDAKNYASLSSTDTVGLDGLVRLMESSPINTLFVTSYNFISPQSKGFPVLPIGHDSLSVNPHLDAMLEAGFDYVGADESHTLRNQGSGYSRYAKALFYRAKFRTIATGTLLNTSPNDLPNQVGCLNPAIYGNEKDFVSHYSINTQGGRVSELNEAHVSELILSLKKSTNYIQIKRKEWAALLPSRRDTYHILGLDSDNPLWQLYQTVLTSVVTDVKKKLEEKRALVKSASAGDDNSEEANNSIESMLRPFLARLEQVLITPQIDPSYTNIMEDLGIDDIVEVSPIIARVIKILRLHLQGVDASELEELEEQGVKITLTDEERAAGRSKPLPGKVMILCNYNTSVDAIYNALPPDLKEMAIRYEASKKDLGVYEFTNNPRKTILIGIQDSLSTGHNFQFATRMIRCEQVWSPGDIEQSESRMNRPDPKNADVERSMLYYDWVAIDGTIGISKLSRLISRMVVNTAIEEHGNPYYASVPQLPLIPMNLDVLQERCWLQHPSDKEGEVTARSLRAYLEVKHQIDKIQQKEFAEWRSNYEGPTKPVVIPSSPPIKDSKVITNIPPVGGQMLANAANFGVINLVKYEGLLGGEHPLPTDGRRVLTPEGDGIIVGNSGTSKVRVIVDDFTRSFDKLCVGLYTTDEGSYGEILASTGLTKFVDRSGADVTSRVLKTVKDETKSKAKSKKSVKPPAADAVIEDDVIKSPVIKTRVRKDLDAPSELPDNIPTSPTKFVPPSTSDEVADGVIEVYAGSINGAIGLTINADDYDISSKEGTRLINSLGFRPINDFLYVEMPTRVAYEAYLARLESKFEIPDVTLERLHEIRDAFKLGRKKLLDVAHATNVEIKAYWLSRYKSSTYTKPKLVVPLPVIEDGVLYLLFDARFVTTKLVRRLRVPGVQAMAQSPNFYVKLYATKSAAASDLRDIQKHYVIENKEDLRADLKALKLLNKGNVHTPPVK